MKIEIGISEQNCLSVTAELNKILADEIILYTKTKSAHWNIEGVNFYQYHILFEKQFVQLDEIIDSVAERIRTLGKYAPNKLSSYLELTHLKEEFKIYNNSESLITFLLADHQSIIMNLRKLIKPFANEFEDLGTSDFITGIMETHEKMAWFLRSHLKS